MKMAQNDDTGEMLPEYEFDYTNAKPNRFAPECAITVTLEPDVAQIFNTSEAVNKALRAILIAIPKTLNYSKA